MSFPMSSGYDQFPPVGWWSTGGAINVKSYGAKGDGITNDTATIQAAFTALRNLGGGALYFPAGTYKFTSTLTVNLTDPYSGNVQSMRIYGDGALSKLYYTAIDGTDALYILGVVGGIPTLHIHDLSLFGAGIGATTGNGLVLRRCIMPALLTNLTIQDFGGGAGIQLISCWTTNIQACWMYQNKYGATFENDAIPGSYGSTVNITMLNSQVQGSVSHGVYCNQSPLHFVVDNCIIEGNTGKGIYLDHARHVDIRNCYFELNDYHVYGIHTPSITISHCTGGGAHPVYTDADCTGMVSIQNEFDNPITLDAWNALTIQSDPPLGAGGGRNLITNNWAGYFVANDATPSVAVTGYGYRFWVTQNTVPTTITDLHDGYIGQEAIILVSDAVTTFDLTGTNLRGNSSADYAASNGDALTFVKGPSYWHLIGITKV